MATAAILAFGSTVEIAGHERDSASGSAAFGVLRVVGGVGDGGADVRQQPLRVEGRDLRTEIAGGQRQVATIRMNGRTRMTSRCRPASPAKTRTTWAVGDSLGAAGGRSCAQRSSCRCAKGATQRAFDASGTFRRSFHRQI